MINLEHLTEEERKIIMDVLQRDEQLRQSEQERVKKLKTELHDLRRKSAVKVDETSGGADSGKKVCARCREPLGTIFNSGEVCPRCQHKVCTGCKVVLPSSKKWLCTICNKQLQIRLESGDAFGPQREGHATVYGSDLVMMSLAKTKTGLEPNIQINGSPQSPADSGFHGRGANVPSVGESTSTTYDDDYPSDISYEQSIGPSVSERGSIAHRGRGAGTNHDDGTIVSNDVEGGRYNSSDITVERVSSRNGSPAAGQRGNADPNMQDPKYNASESGIESVHIGYNNGARGNSPFLDNQSNSISQIDNQSNSISQIDNQSSAVQSSSSNKFKSELSFITQPPKSSVDRGRDSGYDLSMQGICVDKVEHRQQLNDYSQTSIMKPNEGGLISLDSERGRGSAPPFRTTHVLSKHSPLSISTNNAPDSLTGPHTGSPRPSRHVTNKMYVSTSGFSVFNKPTSNSDEIDSVGSERMYMYVGSGAYDSLYQSVSDNTDEKFSDTPGDESSRQSDTDTQSITSSSTVAWDTIADAREMDAKKSDISPEGDKESIPGSSDHQSAGSQLNNSRLTKVTLQQHGGAVASSGYESASSMSITNESRPKTNGMAPSRPFFDFGGRKIVMDEKTLAVLTENEYPTLQYFNSDSMTRWSPDEYVILESDEAPSNVRQSEKVAPDLYRNTENNNLTLTTQDGAPKYDEISSLHPDKSFPTKDILYLQEQGSLLQNLQSVNDANKEKTPAMHDGSNRVLTLVSEEKLEQTSFENQSQTKSQQGESHGKVSGVQLTFHDLGSINSHYKTPQEKGDDSSDCSSVDLSKLDFSDSSDSETFSDYDSENRGRKLLMFGNKLATFENSRKEESIESVTEWGLFDDTDGLVPLVLPGMSSGSEQSVKDKRAASGDESDSLVSSFLKRFIGTPRTPEQSSSSAPDHSDEESSKSFEISSDSDSVDESCLEFDPSLIADSTEEKEAVYKSKLEHNKALMRSLLKELTPDEDPELTSSDNELAIRMKASPQSVVSQSTLAGSSPSSPADQHSEQKMQKRSKRVSKDTNAASPEGSAESKPRRKKRGKSKSKLDDAEASVRYASKKGLMKQSKTQFGVLSSTSDGKTQLYTFGGDKDRPMSPVDLSRGKYSPLQDAGVHQDKAKPSERPRTPFIQQSFPQPQIYRKQPSSTRVPMVPASEKTEDRSSSSSSSSSCDEDDPDEDVVEQEGQDEVDNSSRNSFFRSRTTRQFSVPIDNSSDSELSVIMEEPEEGDLDSSLGVTEQSYDSKL